MRQLPTLIASLMLAIGCCGGAPALAAQSPLERGVLAELNLMRTDPAAYVQKLKAYRAMVDRRGVARVPGETVGTAFREGPRVIDEAIAFLEAQAPLTPLAADEALDRTAQQLAAEQARTGKIGHVGEDGSTLLHRMRREGRRYRTMAETIAYGHKDPMLVAIQLVIDDGVPDRGHRHVIFDPALRLAGVGCGPHPVWGAACVTDYAAGRWTPEQMALVSDRSAL